MIVAVFLAAVIAVQGESTRLFCLWHVMCSIHYTQLDVTEEGCRTNSITLPCRVHVCMFDGPLFTQILHVQVPIANTSTRSSLYLTLSVIPMITMNC